MIKEYAIYPFKHMNITQRHDQGTHIPNWKGSTNYSDLPWDEACENEFRSYFEPQNDFLVEEVLGLGNNITNTVRLKSVNKLYIPYKNEPEYLYLTLSHMNEDNLKEAKQGDILRKGTKILLEGTDGFTTGNHFHITANIGKYYGFLQNSNGAWCFVYQQSLMPNQAFFLDNKYTVVINNSNYSFIDVPNDINIIGDPVLKDENVDQIEINSENVPCRISLEAKSDILGYLRPGIYNYKEILKIGDVVWYNIDIGFVEYNSAFMTVYPKKDKTNEEDNNKNKNIFRKIINNIIAFLKKIFGLD